jgi:hypothetical protein
MNQFHFDAEAKSLAWRYRTGEITQEIHRQMIDRLQLCFDKSQAAATVAKKPRAKKAGSRRGSLVEAPK